MSSSNNDGPRWSLRIIPDREDPSQEVWIFDERPVALIKDHPDGLVVIEGKLNGEKQSIGVRMSAILTWSIESMPSTHNGRDVVPILNTAMTEARAEDFYQK